jgi:hypothetical protein
VQGEFDKKVASWGGESGLRAVAERAATDVDQVLASSRELEAFRGKQILRTFHQRFVNALGLGYKPFAYEVARRAQRRSRLEGLVEVPIRRIKNYVSPTMSEHLRAAEAIFVDDADKQAAREVYELSDRARADWEAGLDTTVDFDSLRALAMRIGHRLADMSQSDLERALAADIVQLGLGGPANPFPGQR